jgi:hypothetical protein
MKILQQKLHNADSPYSTCPSLGSLHQLLGDAALAEYIYLIPSKIKIQKLLFKSKLNKNSMTLFAYISLSVLARFHCILQESEK